MGLARQLLTKLLVRHGQPVLRDLLKPMRRLWLEVTGTMFLAVAFIAAAGTLREWRGLQEGGSLWRLALSVIALVMMLAFGVYSFIKARRIR